MEEHGGALFHIGPLEVNSVMVTTTAICLFLVLLAYFGTRRMQQRPRGLQNVLEKVVEMLLDFLSGVIGEHNARYYLPYLGTLFIFILVSNYSGLLPFAGSLPGLQAPTSAISVTASLAVCTFFMTHYSGLRMHGVGGYAKHFIQPVAFMLPLLILEELIHPLSLTLRLYGNIFGEETVTHEIFKLLPVLAPLAMNALSLLLGFVQAMVFMLLSSIYITTAAGEGH